MWWQRTQKKAIHACEGKQKKVGYMFHFCIYQTYEMQLQKQKREFGRSLP